MVWGRGMKKVTNADKESIIVAQEMHLSEMGKHKMLVTMTGAVSRLWKGQSLPELSPKEIRRREIF